MAHPLEDEIEKGEGNWTCIARATGGPQGSTATLKLMRVPQDVDTKVAEESAAQAYRHFFGCDPEQVGAGVIPFSEEEDERG